MIRTIFTRYIPMMGALGLIGFAILFVNGQDRSGLTHGTEIERPGNC